MSDRDAAWRLWARQMGCFAPPRFAHLRWHVLRVDYPNGSVYERAEWIPKNGAGVPIWRRWGYCGDFAELCHANYVGPAIDQDSPYIHPTTWDDCFEPRDNLAEVTLCH